MTYPVTAGYQAHSQTSKEASTKVNAGQQRAQVLKYIHDCANYGATTDQIKIHLLKSGLIHENSVMSARVRELELSGHIIKTTRKRKTKAGRFANVYVTKATFDIMGYEKETTKEKPIDIIKLEQEHARMKEALKAIVENIEYESRLILQRTAERALGL